MIQSSAFPAYLCIEHLSTYLNDKGDYSALKTVSLLNSRRSSYRSCAYSIEFFLDKELYLPGLKKLAHQYWPQHQSLGY